MTPQLESQTISELLQAHVNILAELRKRGVLRTANNPLGDYTEWLVAHHLGLQLVNNSTTGYDAVDAKNIKYQIKGRRVTPSNASRQLSPIRNLIEHDFDYLIAVIFDQSFGIQKAIKIPHKVIEEYATYRKHVNGHILHVRGAILSDPRVEQLTHIFAET